jgi:transcriptional regulator with XRE-family HTH domain
MASWRDLLKEILAHPGERERLAIEMGVNPLTLTRWINGETVPRQQSLQLLLQAVSAEHRASLLALLQHEYPGLAPSSPVSSADPLSFEFVRTVLEARATTPHPLRFWTITRRVLQHALRQLDPHREGLAITVVSCMPPASSGKIQSLREREGQGTPPWEEDLSHATMLLGADSLAGYTVMTSRPQVVQNLAETGLIPAYRAEYEASAMAAPILYANQIAGCMLVSSTRPGSFVQETRQQMIVDYAHLLALAFDPEEFYEVSCVDLHILPGVEVQRRYFASFQRRVTQFMQEHRELLRVQAERLAWQQIEAELIAYAASPDRES